MLRREFLKKAGATMIALGVPSSFTRLTAQEQPAPAKQTDPKGTGYVFEDKYIRHSLGAGHPESPARLKAIRTRMKESELDRKVTRIRPGDLDPMPYIKMNHSDEHIEKVKTGGREESICRLAVAGSLAAVDAVCTSKVKNAFCAIRPPGHHAENSGEAGFCFYNNVAIAARYAQKKYKLQKILIVDWDYHHGNGTEWSFYSDPSVLFFSTHALFAYPGTGHPGKTGDGKGKGLNINVPLKSGADDKDIVSAFNDKLVPAAEEFKPDMVLISAGFDSRKDDLLGNFNITDDGFRELTGIVMGIAERHGKSRVVSLLEGGYNVEGLALAVQAHVETLLAVKAAT